MPTKNDYQNGAVREENLKEIYNTAELHAWNGTYEKSKEHLKDVWHR